MSEWIKVSDQKPPNHLAIEMRLKIPGRYFDKANQLTFFVEGNPVRLNINDDDEWRKLPRQQDATE